MNFGEYITRVEDLEEELKQNEKIRIELVEENKKLKRKLETIYSLTKQIYLISSLIQKPVKL